MIRNIFISTFLVTCSTAWGMEQLNAFKTGAAPREDHWKWKNIYFNSSFKAQNNSQKKEPSQKTIPHVQQSEKNWHATE